MQLAYVPTIVRGYQPRQPRVAGSFQCFVGNFLVEDTFVTLVEIDRKSTIRRLGFKSRSIGPRSSHSPALDNIQ